MIPYKILEKFDQSTIGEILDKYKNDRITPINSKDDLSKYDIIYHVKNGEGFVEGFEDGNTIKINFNGDTILLDINYLIDNDNIVKIIKSDKSNIETDNNIKTDNNKDDVIEEEEEEEEDDDDDFFEDITISDIMTNSINNFFTDDELTLITTIDDVEKFKIHVEKETPLNDFNKKLKEKRIITIEILENVFDKLKIKFPNRNIGKFNGEIPYVELWDIRQKDYVYYPKTKFSNIVIYYWVFKDIVLFKMK